MSDWEILESSGRAAWRKPFWVPSVGAGPREAWLFEAEVTAPVTELRNMSLEVQTGVFPRFLWASVYRG